ncbi:MAG: hypothetical protein ACOYJZ_06680 [Acutalibacter sp.]|jgi:hypothetical protein
MKLSYEGVAEQVITLEVDTASNPAVTAGTMAAMSANGKVKACPVSTTPVGQVLRVEDGMAAVQVAGYLRVPCDGDMTVGYAQLALDSTGKLAAGTTGRGGLVVDVDTDAGMCGVIFC